MTEINNGKVNVSREAITIKGLIGSTTIKRNDVKSIVHFKGFSKLMRAIVRIVFIVTIFEGIRLLFTPAMVEINTYDNKKPKRIWFSSKDEYDKFCEAL